MTRTTRNILLLAVLLFVIAGAVGGTYYVLNRGSRRQDLYAQAWHFINTDRPDQAEERLRTILRSDPGHARAFTVLARILVAQDRDEEFKQLCDEWIERGVNPQLGWREYVHGLQSQGDFAAAETEALRRAPVDPVLVHSVRQSALELSSDPRRRLGAVDAARRIADLTDSKLQRASSLVRAGELLLGLRSGMQAEVQQRLTDRAQSMFGEALAATSDARRANKLNEPECQLLVARVLMRVGDANEMRDARILVARRMELDEERFSLRVALIRHLLEREDAGEPDKTYMALDLARGMVPARTKAPDGTEASDATDAGETKKGTRRSASPAERLLVLRWFGEFKRHADARVLLKAYFPGAEGNWHLEDLSIGFLLQGTEEDKQLARERALAVIRREEASPAVVRAIVSRFASAGQGGDLIALLEEARKFKGDKALDAWLAALLAQSGDEGAGERASTIADELGRGNLALGESAAALTLLQGANPEVVRKYLDARIEASEEARAAHRFQRARLDIAVALAAERATKPEEATAARARALADIAAIAADPAAEPRVLAQASELAYALRDPKALGACVAATVGRADAITLLGVKLVSTIEQGMFDDEARSELAQALRAGAEGMPAGAVCEALADVVDDPKTLVGLPDVLEKLAQTGECEVPARLIAMALASKAADPDAVESNARALLKRLPDSREMRLNLGAALMRAGKLDDILTLYETVDELAPGEYALLATTHGRKNELEETRRLCHAAIDKFPTDPRAFLVLAESIGAEGPREGENAEEEQARESKEALRVLSAAPRNRVVELARARLYATAGIDQPDRAAEIYAALIMASVLDMGAQRGYLQLLMDSDRHTDAISFVNLMLTPDAEKARVLGDRFDGYRMTKQHIAQLTAIAERDPHGATRLFWSTMRGNALERSGYVREALQVYRETNDRKRSGGNFMTLNNGAWILAEIARETMDRGGKADDELQTAKEWVERALQLNGDLSNINDTAAHVYALMRDFDNALAAIDRAIELAVEPAEDPSRFMFHRARICEASGDREAALKQLESVIETYQGDPVEREARIYRDGLPPLK